MTRPSPCVIELSDADRALLRKRSRDYTARYADVVRAKIVLLSADGQPNTAIAARLDVHVDTVRRWRNRFFESGLGGLADRAHPKRTTSVPAETVVQGQVVPVTGPDTMIGVQTRGRRPTRRSRGSSSTSTSTASAPVGQLITFVPRFNTTLDALRQLAASINSYLDEVEAEHARVGRGRVRRRGGPYR